MRNPYFSLLQIAWKYARHERKKYLLVYTLFIVANIICLLHPLLFGWFVGKLQNNTSQVLYYTILYATGYWGLKFSEWSLHGPARIMERSLAFNISRNFLQEKFHQTLHLTTRWHQDHHSGATINRIRKAYEALRDFFNRGFMYLLTYNKFVFSVSAILIFSPLFGSIAVLLGMITIWVISKFNKPFIKALREMNEKEHQVSSYLFDSLSNIRTIITLRLEKSMENGLLQKVGMVFPLFRKYTVINEWKWFVADMLISLIYGIVVAGFVYQHWEPGKVFYIGSLITLLGYVNQFTSVFSNVAGQYTDIVQYKAHIDGATLISDAFKEQHRSDSSCALPSQWRHMEISRLHFSHREVYDVQHTSQSLHNIHLNIERGKRIALIGASGSGKSSLFALLRGLHQPEEGACFMVDGAVYPLDSLHGTITLFPQEPEIFENTIEYNVTLGLPFSEEEIMKVCEQAHFSEVINELPQGLLTDIREKGVNLSGGQKQRLALARGILAARDSDVILLDEPTSSVDSKTEAMIYDKLFKTFSNKAMISSMHRLHLLDRFDYIYVLDQGRIIEEGTLDHLLLSSHVFKELWHHQNLHYISELYK